MEYVVAVLAVVVVGFFIYKKVTAPSSAKSVPGAPQVGSPVKGDKP